MARKAVMDAVNAYLAANWTGAIQDVNKSGETPADGSTFLVVQYLGTLTQQITIGDPGNNIHRESGVIRLVLNVRRGGGLADIAKADSLSDLFLHKTLVSGAMRTWVPSSPNLADQNEEGKFYQMTVSVPYQYDFLG